MVPAPSGISLERFAELVRDVGLACVRLPDPTALVRGVAISAPGDPAPDPGTAVLCAGLDHDLPGSTAAAVVRESELSRALPELPTGVAVFTISTSSRWSDVYDRLQTALAESSGPLLGHDAFQLADTLAISLGGAVAIEDVDRRVIAFSAVPGHWIDDVRRQGILGRKVPEHLERDEWYARLWREPGVVEFRAGAESTARVAVAVRVGGQPVGSVWVVGSRDTLSSDADSILEAATTDVATCLAGQDRSAARSRESRARVVEQLLSGFSDEQQGGYVPLGPTVLIATSRVEPSDDPELLDARLADLLSVRAQRYRGAGLAAPLDGKVYALLPFVQRSQLEPLLRSILGRAGVSHGYVAASGVLRDSQALPSARHQVDRLLRLRQGKNESGIGVLYVSDELSALWLSEVAESVRDTEVMKSGIVNDLVEYDQRHGTEYVTSLRAWFECCGDVSAAAAKVHVHPNTFRYRLARASEIFGLRTDDADERLLLHLQLRLGEQA